MSSDADFREFQRWKESQKPKDSNKIVTKEMDEPFNGKQNADGTLYVVNYVSKNKTLYVHLMANKNHEIEIVKRKVYDTEFDWNKKTFNVHPEFFITDKIGDVHYYCDINDTYGGLSFNKEHIEQCNECGKSLSKDSQISYNLTRKRNLTGIWGVDNAHMILLMILGIGLMLCLVAVFYIVGMLNETQKQLDNYLPKNGAPSSTVTSHLIIGGILNYDR